MTLSRPEDQRNLGGCRRAIERGSPSGARRWPLPRPARVALFALATLAIPACSDSGPSGAASSGPAALPALPPPPDLAIECVLPTPDASWEKARAQIGGAAAFLPKSAGGLVAVTLHFPIAVSEAIDGRSPAVCAATLAAGDAAPRFVTGVHLRWPDRLLDGLTKGADARFEVATDPATRIEILKARDPKDAVMAAGVSGNYLLLAARPEDLTALGPYVARTMPSRAKDFPTAGVRLPGTAAPGAAAPGGAPAADFLARVPPAAMGGPIAAAAARAWSGLTERLAGKLPIPVLDAETGKAALALLPDLDGADVRVTLDERSTRVEASAPLRPGSPGDARARALAAGDVTPLLALPKDTLAALLLRRAPVEAPPASASVAASAAPAASTSAAASAAATASASPIASAPAAASAAATATASASASASAAASAASSAGTPPPTLAAMLGLAEPEDAARIESVGRAFDAARGDWLAAGFAFDGTGPSAFVRAAVRDPAALDGALADFFKLADRASPRDPVKGQPVTVTTGKTVLENIPGDVYRLRLARGANASGKSAAPPASATDTPAAVDVLFRRADDVFVAATGYASRDILRALLAAPAGENVRGTSEIAAPLERLGPDLAFAAFVDPARLAASRAGKPGSVAPAPVVIGLGRTTGATVTVFAKIEASGPAISQVVRFLDP